MTRKRFMKLVMAAGYNRNEAAQMVARARESGSYADFFNSIRLRLDVKSATMAFIRLGCALRGVTSEYQGLVDDFEARFAAWV